MRALQEAEHGSHISGAEKMRAWTENASSLSLARSARRPQLMSPARRNLHAALAAAGSADSDSARQ